MAHQNSKLIIVCLLVNYMDTITKGIITELKCITYLLELGYNVSIPQKITRYDFILDTGVNLYKVQVKTCNVSTDGSTIIFSTASRRQSRTGTVSHNYLSDGIDYFCTWHNNRCYFVPVEDCGAHKKNLRLAPTRSGQSKNISFAEDYLVENILISRNK